MRLAIVVAGVLVAGAAWGRELPSYDVDRICVSAYHGNASSIEECVYEEQRSYNHLKYTAVTPTGNPYDWSDLPDDVQGGCVKMVDDELSGRSLLFRHPYVRLEACASSNMDKIIASKPIDIPKFKP